MKMTLEQAMVRIKELEAENAALRSEVEEYRNRKMSGRKRHNEEWMKSYQDFCIDFEGGMTMLEISEKRNVSVRTLYRYKKWYDEMRSNDMFTV